MRALAPCGLFCASLPTAFLKSDRITGKSANNLSTKCPRNSLLSHYAVKLLQNKVLPLQVRREDGGVCMENTLEELRWKEVIGVSNGIRYGFVSDVVIDLSSGCVKALIVPGRARFFGLFGSREPQVLSWKDIRHIGEDIILVEGLPHHGPPRRERRKFF